MHEMAPRTRLWAATLLPALLLACASPGEPASGAAPDVLAAGVGAERAEGVGGGEAELRFSGAVEGTLEGTAFWIERPHPISGQPVFTFLIEARASDELRVVEMGHLRGAFPGEGDYPVRSLDELPAFDADPSRIPNGFLGTYTSGRWESWREIAAYASGADPDLADFNARLTGMATSTGGTVRLEARDGDLIEGSFSLTLALSGGDGPEEQRLQVDGTFRATRLDPESPGGSR
jgi:hypothetical protein